MISSGTTPDISCTISSQNTVHDTDLVVLLDMADIGVGGFVAPCNLCAV